MNNANTWAKHYPPHCLLPLERGQRSGSSLREQSSDIFARVDGQDQQLFDEQLQYGCSSGMVHRGSGDIRQFSSKVVEGEQQPGTAAARVAHNQAEAIMLPRESRPSCCAEILPRDSNLMLTTIGTLIPKSPEKRLASPDHACSEQNSMIISPANTP